MKDTQPQKQSSPTQSKPSCLSCCKDLIFEVFISIIEDNDHSRLGEGDTEAAWDAIRDEYDKLTGGAGYNNLVLLLAEVNRLATKVQLIEAVAKVMHEYYVPEFGQLLSNYGMHYEWIGISDEKYAAQLDSVISRSKTFFIQWKAKKKEWDRLTDVDKQKSNMSHREYFEDWLIGLSKEQGYHIKATDITTYQFAIMYRKGRDTKKAKK